jgi:xanthosine utilization system XapX-like protein
MFLILINVIFLILLVWLASRHMHRQLSRGWFWVGCGLRLIAAFAFGAIYFIYLGEGDTLHFFSKASELSDMARSDWTAYVEYLFSSQFEMYKADRRDGFFIKAVSFFCLLTGDHYWLTTAYFALISFFATWYFIGSLSSITQNKHALVFAFLLLPTPIFWTSGVMKDTLVWVAMMISLGGLLKIKKPPGASIGEIIVGLIGLFILFRLRYFLFGITFGVCVIVILDQILLANQATRKTQFLTWGISFVAIICFISLLNPNLYLSNFPQALFDNYQQIIQNSEADKALIFEPNPTWESVILHLPQSLFAGLFRPFLGEGSPWIWLHGLENLLILSGFTYSIIKIKSVSSPGMSLLCAIGFLLILAALMPLASPNFGTLMRYKAAYLPFLSYFTLYIPLSRLFLNQSIKS